MFYLKKHDGSTTNGKYAYEVPSHLFKPFFKKLEQEFSDCKSGKGCEVINRNSTLYPVLFNTFHASSYSFKSQALEKLSLFSRRHFSIQNKTLWSCQTLPYKCRPLNFSAEYKLIFQKSLYYIFPIRSSDIYSVSCT